MTIQNFKHCYPILMNKTEQPNVYKVKFDFIKDAHCDENLINDEFHILYNDNFRLIIFYGCYENNKNESDQGMWIFASDDMMDQMKADNFRDTAVKVLKDINPSLIDDMIMYNEDEEQCYCDTCDYFMKCKTEIDSKRLQKSGVKGMSVDWIIVVLFFNIVEYTNG
jgi:hypothetical protein